MFVFIFIRIKETKPIIVKIKLIIYIPVLGLSLDSPIINKAEIHNNGIK